MSMYEYVSQSLSFPDGEEARSRRGVYDLRRQAFRGSCGDTLHIIAIIIAFVGHIPVNGT